MCQREAKIEWKWTLKVTGGFFQPAPVSEVANISTDELWQLKKEKAVAQDMMGHNNLYSMNPSLRDLDLITELLLL